MLLNTISSDFLLESIANVLCSDKKTIIEFFDKEAKGIIGDRYNEYSIEDLSLNYIKEFCSCSKMQVVDEIVVHHFTPRASYDQIMQEDIMPLPQALVCDTELSRYLEKRGFEFEFSDNRILSKRNGDPIDWNNLRQSNMLMRFGGQYSFYDYNVNGYLFATEWLLDFCRGWLGSPEILKSISTAFNDHSIADDYASKCRNYLVSFKVGLENVDIECKNASMSNAEKTELILKYSINALAHWQKGKQYLTDCYNPIIMLKRDYTVTQKDIIATHKLKVENHKVMINNTEYMERQ